ncbi:hypothetical protein [Bosea sp. BK604]|uniref:hypothetical protein n=1 Tax=Bosea sp. BK604 TaxID=2512180 RepID=UPI0010457AE9|nr:hypothetical protein [Bosea sp. BK604]TCR64643.1 hypothetical protein EV560_106106 [Bosea sp. BK604]
MGEPKKIVVGCEDDYERARARAKELVLAEPGSEAEAELIDLEEAADTWEAQHQDDEDGPSNAPGFLTATVGTGLVLAVVGLASALIIELAS